MSEHTKIQWADATWNAWRGCRKISEGCDNCYITETAPFRVTGQKHGKVRVIASEDVWRLPHRLNKNPFICPNGNMPMKGAPGGHGPYSADVQKEPTPCPECGSMLHRARIFTLSLGDIWDSEVPLAQLTRLLVTIWQCPNVDFLCLSKRVDSALERMAAVLADNNAGSAFDSWLYQWLHEKMPPRNVWIGFSAENQARLDERWAEAWKIPAAVHFISVEPMLGAMDFSRVIREAAAFGMTLWPIFGGESGDGARACNVEWIRDGLRQFHAADIRCFVKQVGSQPLNGYGQPLGAIGTSLHDKKGGDMAEWPEDLRVRQFPV